MLNKSQCQLLKEKIDNEYRVNMILDNLPVAEPRQRHGNGNTLKFYDRGFAVGLKFQDGKRYFIHNHLSFDVLYHPIGEGSARIVGFEVKPFRCVTNWRNHRLWLL